MRAHDCQDRVFRGAAQEDRSVAQVPGVCKRWRVNNRCAQATAPATDTIQEKGGVGEAVRQRSMRQARRLPDLRQVQGCRVLQHNLPTSALEQRRWQSQSPLPSGTPAGSTATPHATGLDRGACRGGGVRSNPRMAASTAISVLTASGSDGGRPRGRWRRPRQSMPGLRREGR